MITSVRFCLSYDLLNAISRLQSLFISMKICIVLTDVVMTLLVPAVVITLFLAHRIRISEILPLDG